MELSVNLAEKQSTILIKQDIRLHLSDYLDLNRKVLIICDDGVPQTYQEEILAQCPNGYLFVTKHGEQAKSFQVYQQICKRLLKLNFSRNDLIIALGGGVIGDLSGFVAATFKRGIHFASIPTTTLAQIDSSIGGKVAINMDEVKNVIGTFYHPEYVFIDINTLNTLDPRHYYNGLAEAVKAGLIADEALFKLFEESAFNFDTTHHIDPQLEEIITRSLIVKKNVVEEDEKEVHLRKILNFGHTIGHAIESIYHLHDYYHGECVALGMMKILEDEQIRQKLANVLKKLHLPLEVPYNKDEVMQYILNDKKADHDSITVVKVNQIGKAELVKMPIQALGDYL